MQIATILAALALSAAGGADDGRIVFTRGDYPVIYTVRPDGSGLRRLARRSGGTEPSWSPDRRRIVAVARGGLAIWMAEGRIVRVIPLHARGIVSRPTWSPDGKRLAYLVEVCEDPDEPRSYLTAGCADLWTVRADGRGRRRLVSGRVDTVNFGPHYDWSPDGRTIVYQRVPTRSRRQTVALVDVATGRSRLVRNAVAADDPTWSPDGRRIAFARQRGPFKGSDLYTSAPDGSGLRRLTRGVSHVEQPLWSPDGRHLAYLVFLPTPGENRWGINVAASDGSGGRRIAVATDESLLRWSPDSTRLLWKNFDGYLWMRREDASRPAVRLVRGEAQDW